jgi:ubiquinol-cytochrome c reductase subunit 6
MAGLFGLRMPSLFQSIRSSFVVKAEEDEELVDAQEVIREKCKTSKCQQLAERLDSCNARVSSRKKTTETCYEEIIDLMHCVDHCAAKPLFSKLK